MCRYVRVLSESDDRDGGTRTHEEMTGRAEDRKTDERQVASSSSDQMVDHYLMPLLHSSCLKASILGKGMKVSSSHCGSIPGFWLGS